MPDQPDETQKQRRSAVMPPFFAPRSPRPTTPSQSATATPPRRPSQLFTPPGVPKQPRSAPFKTPLATPRVTPFAAPVVAGPPAVEPVPEPAPPAPTPDATEPPPIPVRPDATAAHVPNEGPAVEAGGAVPSGDGFVIEQYESPPISLEATGEQGVVSDDPSIAFQVYDDAARLLERGARPVPPEAGGLEIERTEVTFEAPAPPLAPLEVESFWAAAPMPAAAPPPAAASAPLGNEPVHAAPVDEGRAADEPPPLPEPEPVEAAPAPPVGFAPMPVPSWLDEPPAEPAMSAELPSREAAAPEAAADIPPLPERPAAARPMPGPAPASAPDDADADEALAEAFAEPAPNESVPRWATPRAVRAVEQGAPSPADAWGIAPVPAPPDELAAALAWPDSGLRARTPAMGLAAQGRGDTSHELAASAEGWPLSVGGRPGVPDAVATALERIAQRVRAGEVPLPADVALAKSDESALALTLAALLRGSSTPRA